jgi:hypothetical protein
LVALSIAAESTGTAVESTFVVLVSVTLIVVSVASESVAVSFLASFEQAANNIADMAAINRIFFNFVFLNG